MFISIALMIAAAGCAVRTFDPPGLLPARRPPAPAGTESAAAPRWERIGTSVRGKPLEVTQFGAGPRRIYIVGGMRGDEPEAPRAARDIADRLTHQWSEAHSASATIRIVRDVNPDGTARGTRTNTRDVDLSRNWPTTCYQDDPRHGRGPASEIEVAAVVKDIATFKPDLVIVFGSSARGPRVMFDGAAAPLGGVGGQRMAYEFAMGARRADPRWRAMPDRPHTAPGSLEALIGNDMKKPVLIVEFQRGRDGGPAARSGLDALLDQVATLMDHP